MRYDWDDINFSELVVETSTGELRQLVVNPDPTANQYSVPRVTDFVIEDVSRLGVADERVREAYRAAQIPARWWLILGGMAVPAGTFVLLLRYHRRLESIGGGTPCSGQALKA